MPSASRNDGNKFQGNAMMINGEIQGATEEDVKKMLTDIFIDNARLRKQVNSVICCALRSSVKLDNQQRPAGDDTAHSTRTVLNKLL